MKGFRWTTDIILLWLVRNKIFPLLLSNHLRTFTIWHNNLSLGLFVRSSTRFVWKFYPNAVHLGSAFLCRDRPFPVLSCFFFPSYAFNTNSAYRDFSQDRISISRPTFRSWSSPSRFKVNRRRRRVLESRSKFFFFFFFFNPDTKLKNRISPSSLSFPPFTPFHRFFGRRVNDRRKRKSALTTRKPSFI